MRSDQRETRTGGTWVSDEDWVRLWHEFTTSAFRLEALPAYPRDDDVVEQFTAGRPMPVGFNAPWHNRLRVHRHAGRTVLRVRLLDHPLTEYQRFQFEWEYMGNARAGEDIRVVRRTDEVAEQLPDHDFWLFDHRTVVLLHHWDDGATPGRELVDGDPAEYVRYEELALAHAMPHRHYPRVG